MLAPHWALAAAGLAVWGIFYQLVIVNSISYRMQVTPDALQGRVNTAGRVLSWGLGWSAGAAIAGLLEPVIGLRWAMLELVLLCAVAAVYARVSPLATHVDDPILAD